MDFPGFLSLRLRREQPHGHVVGSQEGKHHGGESLCQEGFSGTSFHQTPLPLRAVGRVSHGGACTVFIFCIFQRVISFLNQSGLWKFWVAVWNIEHLLVLWKGLCLSKHWGWCLLTQTSSLSLCLSANVLNSKWKQSHFMYLQICNWHYCIHPSLLSAHSCNGLTSVFKLPLFKPFHTHSLLGEAYCLSGFLASKFVLISVTDPQYLFMTFIKILCLPKTVLCRKTIKYENISSASGNSLTC